MYGGYNRTVLGELLAFQGKVGGDGIERGVIGP
jgi:hypothetical protein